MKKIQQNRILKAARIKQERLLPFLNSSEHILDIGSGNGGLVHLLHKKGIQITPSDISNKSIFPDITPVILKGSVLPFKNDAFDTVLLITMLHHTPQPIDIIKEAMRVGKRLIIMEDIYENKAQKKLTLFMDSLVNMEFKGHPHTNKDDKEWKKVFHELNLELTHVEYYNFLLFFKQVTYILHKPSSKIDS